MLRTCHACGAVNRIPARHLASRGKCGKCKAALAPLESPLDIADVASFDAIIREATVPVLVDFWADWCGPCKMVAPEIVRAAAALAGRAVVVKVDTERLPALAARYRVQGIPNFAVFRAGQVVFQQAGAVRQADLVRWVEEAATGAETMM